MSAPPVVDLPADHETDLAGSHREYPAKISLAHAPDRGGASRRVGRRGTFGRPIVERQLGESANVEHAADGPFRAAAGFLDDHAQIAPDDGDTDERHA